MTTAKSNWILAFIITAFLGSASFAQTPPVSPDMQMANEYLQAQKWPEAASAFESIVKAEPNNGRAWFNLGWARHGLGKYQEAIDAFQKPLELNKGTARESNVMYAIATMYAGMKDRDKAIEWLNKAVAAHYPALRSIASDPNLVGLRDDQRYKDMVAAAIKAASVCLNTPEYRSFDFWVGEWLVSTASNPQAGKSKVDILADGCIVSENWENMGGGVGKSYNFYNPSTKKWHQSYMDNAGNNWMMDGELKDGVLRYEGVIFSPTGKVLVHMNFYNNGPDMVRQTAETSSDGGKTWASVWDGMYKRVK